MTAVATPILLLTPSVPREYTEKELLKLADDGVSEFVDGQVREQNISADANWTMPRLG